MTVVAIAMLGFLHRHRVRALPRRRGRSAPRWRLPVWLICGFLVPLDALPAWVRPISWVLAPTWGMAAIRAAAGGGDPWPDLAACAGLAAVAYGVIGVFLARRLVNSARPHATLALSLMTSLRIFFIGGLTSYRALFNWLTPWILIPTFMLGPILQILLFAYIGRTAGVGDDRFFLIGNAVQYAAIPCLFAMGNTIGDERQQGTLPLLLASPARRIPLFLGRALPVIVNGFVVAVVALGVGALLLQVRLPGSATWLPLALVVAVCSFSCTGLGWSAPRWRCACGRPRCSPTSSSASC